jgi:glycosyltransferase involved in cell wall biosynthesis
MVDKTQNIKRIAIVVPTLDCGGAEKVSVNLANYYNNKGYLVSFIVFNLVGSYQDNLENNIDLINLKCNPLSCYFKLVHQLRKIDPNIVISALRDSNIFTGFCKPFILNAKIIMREANTMHGLLKMPAIKRVGVSFLMKLSYIGSDRVIANSFDTKKDLLKFKIAPEKKIVVIGNPVLSDKIKEKINEKVVHKWLSSNKKYKVIINVGRLHYQKNQKHLIRAFKNVHLKIPQSRLLIIGEGPEKKKLISLANDLGIEKYIDILSFVNNPYPYYSKSDIFVLTSRWEGFGNVIVEAMASRVPVISVDCPGGPSMILEDGIYGVLVGQRDVDLLSKSIIDTMGLDNNSVIDSAELHVKKYSLSIIAEKYLKTVI